MHDSTTTTKRPPNGLTVALLTGMLIVHNAQRMSVVPVFDALRERYGIDYAGVGTLFAAYVLGYAIFQTVIGLSGDRFDPRRLLLTGLALSALWSALFAFASDFHLALILRFLLGATSALLYTPAMTLGILLFDRAQRGRVLGTIQVGAGVGMGGALIVVPVVLSRAGFSASFLTLPVFAVLLLALASRLLPATAPRERTVRPAGDQSLAQRPDFWNLIAMNFSGMLASYGLLTWLPTYLTRDYGFSAVEAGSLSALLNAAMLLSAPIIGLLVDQRGGRIGVLAVGSMMTVLCYMTIVPHQPLPVIVLIAILIGISMSATTAPMMLFGGERFGAADTSRVVGLFSSAAQVGAALAGSLFGVLLARYDSFPLIWATCAALALVRVLLFAALVTHDRKAARHAIAVQAP
ncbi:MAG TPA: MFS transporter [Thermomicrobiales bacterium]|jgi:predicted MFS family arabinose efflux permease